MHKSPHRYCGFFVIGFFALLLHITSGYAWKTATHAADANQALDELIPVVQQNGAPALVRYHGIDLDIEYTDAYRAIINNEKYFRMGNLGPDAFPDLVSGQIYLHPDNGGALNTKIPASRKLEDRTKPEQFRSIDYAMLLLKEAKESGDDQSLAFALGYMAHVSSDGFSHTWVNEKTNGAWDYFSGEGLFGILTEEVKHMAVEGLINKKVPNNLLSTNAADSLNRTDGNRLDVEAPYAMLDKFFNRKYGGEHIGGAIYDYFETQGNVLSAIESGIDGPLSILEEIGGIGPGSVESILWLMEQIPGFDIFASAASEIAKFYILKGNSINPVNMYFDEVRDNIDALKRKNVSYRRNWMVMSSATMENIIKANCVGNADRCTLVNNDQHLDYAGLSGSDLTLFKNEIKELFKLEEEKDHHKLSHNVERQLNYLKESFLLDNLPEVLIPSKVRSAWIEFKEWLCNNNNYIVDLYLYPIATTVVQAACAVDDGVCATDCIVNDCAYKIVNCIADRESDCVDCGMNPICWAAAPACAASAPVWCAVEGIVGCTGCHIGCVYDFTTCTIENIFDFNSNKKLCDAVDDILEPLDQLKQYIVDYLTSVACDIASEIGAPIKDLHRVVAIYRTIDSLEQYGHYGFVNFAYLKEDLQDSVWYNKLSAGNPQLESLFNNIINGNFSFIGKELATLPIEVPSNCLDLSTTGAFYKDHNFGILMACNALFAEPGPTARKIDAEVGGNLIETFDVFYNTIQATKLVGMESPSDIDNAFTKAGVDASLLPWRGYMDDYYSQICTDYPNVFCDAVASLDDPNCTNCTEEELQMQSFTHPTISNLTLDWARKRGVVAWNPYDPENAQWKPYTNTNFLFSTTNDIIEKLYCKIFRVPVAKPTWTTFDDDPPEWKGPEGTTLTTDTIVKSEGNGSMRVDGCNYMLFTSPKTNTTEFGMISHTLSVDVFIPALLSDPNWPGAVQLYVDIPKANLNNAWVGQVELTLLSSDSWNTLNFELPEEVYNGFAGDYPNCELRLALNNPGCNNSYRIDNLRFTGDVKARTVFHTRGSRNLDVAGNSLFSFDNDEDWTSDVGQISIVQSPIEEGNGAISVSGGGFIPIKSRSFSAGEMTNITNKINIDLYVPSPQPNQYWVGALALKFSCPSHGIIDRWIDQRELTTFFYEEYNSAIFTIPEDVLDVLRSDASDCTFEIDLNINNGTGAFLIDKMGFVQ